MPNRSQPESADGPPPADYTRVGRKSDFASHAEDENGQADARATSDVAPRSEGFDDDAMSELDSLAAVADATPGDDASDDAYELQDHEFTLVVEDPTLEILTAEEPPPVGTEPPPLPPWAAVSRALLDTSLDGREDQTVEIPPPETLSRTSASEPLDIDISVDEDGWADPAEPQAESTDTMPAPGVGEDAELREQLANLTRHSHAREVYLREVERALASANGRLRGQSFRIAELERLLHEAAAAAPTPSKPRAKRLAKAKAKAKAKPRAETKPRAKLPAKAKPRTKTPATQARAKTKRKSPKTKRAAAKSAAKKRKFTRAT